MKQFPTPITGLSLSVGSLFWLLDNVFQLNTQLQTIGAIVAFFLLIPVIVKYVIHPNLLIEDLHHPTIGSVIPTFAMSLMVISYAITKNGFLFGTYLWLFSICLHLIFLFFFIKGRLNHFDIEHIIPSWFVPPIGIIVGVTTLPSNDFHILAEGFLWFGFISYLVMLPIMLKRFFFYPEINKDLLANTGIMAAPASLTLTGYLSLIENPNFFITNLLFGIALLMTFSVYLFLIKIIKNGFNYGFSALTFPLVISATGLRLYLNWAEQFSGHNNFMHIVLNIEIIMAVLIVSYVFCSYLLKLKKEIKTIAKNS